MYSTTEVRVTFFPETNKQSTEKVFYGRVSEAIKTRELNQDGTAKYTYENWPARFVGKAYQKALTLKEKDKIILKQWAAHNIYIKGQNGQNGRGFTYLLISDFDVYVLQNSGYPQNTGAVPTAPPQGTYAPSQGAYAPPAQPNYSAPQAPYMPPNVANNGYGSPPTNYGDFDPNADFDF